MRTWYHTRMVWQQYAFSFSLATGAFAGLLWAVWRSGKNIENHVLGAGLCAMLGALVGARSVYVIAHWAYFRTHLSQAWQVHLGGLAWPGAR